MVGSDNSIGLRGDGKICINNDEKINLNLNHLSNGGGLSFNLKSSPCYVGVGYISRLKIVFFTVNGKEVY